MTAFVGGCLLLVKSVELEQKTILASNSRGGSARFNREVFVYCFIGQFG